MRDAAFFQKRMHAPRAIDEVVLVGVAAIDIERLQFLEMVGARLRDRQRIPVQPVLPALGDELAGVRIDRQADVHISGPIGIEGGRLAQHHDDVDVGVLGLLRGEEILQPDFRIAADGRQRAQHDGKFVTIQKVEPHIAGMHRRRRPEIGIEQRVDHRAIAAGAFAEDAAFAFAAAAEFLFDGRHGFFHQEVGPAAGAFAVDVLVAAEFGEAIGKGDDARRHRAGCDQPVEALGHVLAEILPVGMRRAAGGEADNVHQQRQSMPVMAGGDVDVDEPLRRIAERFSLQDFAVDGPAVNVARGGGKVASHGQQL